MDNMMNYIIGDAFTELHELNNVHGFSQFLKMLDANTAKAGTYVIAQGLDDERLTNLQAYLSSLGRLDDFELIRKQGRRVDKALVHKVNGENVFITEPEEIEPDVYRAHLALDDRCAEMMDHTTGKHLQGNILIEAARQMFMATVEEHLMDDKKKGVFSYALNQMSVEFQNFVFPLEVGIQLTLRNISWKGEHSLKCIAETEFIQLDQPCCKITCRGTGYPKSVLKDIEDTRALEVFSMHESGINTKHKESDLATESV